MRDKLTADKQGCFGTGDSSLRPEAALGFKSLFFYVVLLMILGACNAQAQSVADDGLVTKFFALREQTLDQRGTTAQVEQILSLFKVGGHYEHPAASITMTLDQARSGMLAHLKEGRDAKITINKFHHGPDFTIAETSLRYFVPEANGQLKKIERNGVAIFEFEDGRIVRIAEY